MMNFSELERHYQLLQIIEKYQRLLSQYDAGIGAGKLDGMPCSRTRQTDRFGDMLVKKELAAKKLQRLQALVEIEAPQVEETIKGAVGRGRNAIRIELIMRARYLNGRDWPEICDLFHEASTKQMKALIENRLEKLEL